MSKIGSGRKLILLLIVISITITAGTIIFFLQTGLKYSQYSYPLWSQPLIGSAVYDQLRVGDVNGDNLDDVVVSGHQSLEIVFQNSTGHFTNRTKLFDGETDGGFVLADLTGDGALDICSRNGTSSIVVLANNGTGSFNVLETHTLGTIKRVFSISSNQTVPDVAIFTIGSQNVIHLFSNNGSGYLTQNSLITLTPQRNVLDILSSDMNSDDQDEIIVLQDDGNLTMWTGGTLLESVNISRYLASDYDAWLVGLDINADGEKDIGVAANQGPSRSILAFLSARLLNYGEVICEKQFGYAWLGACAADLDKDLDNDIILATLQGSLVVIENSQTGQIGTSHTYSGFTTPHSPSIITLKGRLSPAIIFLAQTAGSQSLVNLIDIITIWRDQGLLP